MLHNLRHAGTLLYEAVRRVRAPRAEATVTWANGAPPVRRPTTASPSEAMVVDDIGLPDAAADQRLAA